MSYKLRVIIESPYAGKDDRLIAAHVEYARMCVRNSIMRGEAPVAFHLLYTQPRILKDHDPEERALGMHTARVWYECADLCAVYTDMGVSLGMQAGIVYARQIGLMVEHRKLGDHTSV